MFFKPLFENNTDSLVAFDAIFMEPSSEGAASICTYHDI